MQQRARLQFEPCHRTCSDQRFPSPSLAHQRVRSWVELEIFPFPTQWGKAKAPHAQLLAQCKASDCPLHQDAGEALHKVFVCQERGECRSSLKHSWRHLNNAAQMENVLVKGRCHRVLNTNQRCANSGGQEQQGSSSQPLCHKGCTVLGNPPRSRICSSDSSF